MTCISDVGLDHAQPPATSVVLFGADEACCTRAADFFDSASTLSSRNCYCDRDVLERLMAAEELADLSSTDFFDACGCAGTLCTPWEPSHAPPRLLSIGMKQPARKVVLCVRAIHATIPCHCRLQAYSSVCLLHAAWTQDIRMPPAICRGSCRGTFSMFVVCRRTIGIVIPYYTENKKGKATGICAGCAAKLAQAQLQLQAVHSPPLQHLQQPRVPRPSSYFDSISVAEQGMRIRPGMCRLEQTCSLRRCDPADQLPDGPLRLQTSPHTHESACSQV